LRLFRAQDGQPGVLRTMLSDSYGIIDNLDVLTAALEGLKAADTGVEIRECDLSDTTMRAKVYSPAVAALAPRLLGGYRDPFATPALSERRRSVSTDLDHWRRVAHREGLGYDPGTEPVVFAGFRISNSETGDGAFTLKPELYVKICRNGLTLPLPAVRTVHHSTKMDIGPVVWSQDTRNKQLAVLTAKTRDAVRHWLSPEFLAAQIDRIEHHADKPVGEPSTAVTVLAKTLGFTDAEREGILAHFIAGGQLTAGGIAHAVTSYSQTITDSDRAEYLDDRALHAMTLL
jgi:hypothetical protein